MRAWPIVLAGCSFELSGGGVQHDASVPDATTDGVPVDAATCPPGFAALAGAPPTSHYRVLAGRFAFTAAVTACSDLGARVHLARLDSRPELDALFAAVAAQTPDATDTRIYRVVGTRHDNGTAPDTWHDLDGSQLAFLPWGVGEPTNLAGEGCMSMRLEVGAPPQPAVTGADQCTTLHEVACECE